MFSGTIMHPHARPKSSWHCVKPRPPSQFVASGAQVLDQLRRECGAAEVAQALAEDEAQVQANAGSKARQELAVNSSLNCLSR